MFTCEMKILTLATPKSKCGKAKSACKAPETQKQNNMSCGNAGVQKPQGKGGQKANKGINKKCQQQLPKNTNNNNNLVKNQNILDDIMQLTPLQNANANNLSKTRNTPQMLHTPYKQHITPDTVITHNNKDTSAANANTPRSSINGDNNDLPQSLLSRNQRSGQHRQPCEPASSAANPADNGASQSNSNGFTSTPTSSQTQATGNENKKTTGSTDTSCWANNAKADEPSTSNTIKSSNVGLDGNDGHNFRRTRNWKNNRHYSSTEDRKNYERNYERNDAPKTNYAQSRQHASYEALKQNPLNYDATKQTSSVPPKQAKPNSSVSNSTSSKQQELQTPKKNPSNAFDMPSKSNAFATTSKPSELELSTTPHFELVAPKEATPNFNSTKPAIPPHVDNASRQSNIRYDHSSKPPFDAAATRNNNTRYDNQRRSGSNYETSKTGASNYEANRQHNNRFDSSRQHPNNFDSSRRSSMSYDSGHHPSSTYDAVSKQDASSRHSTTSRLDSGLESNSRVSGSTPGSTNRSTFQKSEYRCGSADCLRKNLVCPHKGDLHVSPTRTSNQQHNNRFNHRRNQFYRNNNHYGQVTPIRRDRLNSGEHREGSKDNMPHGGGNNQGRYQNSFRNNNNNKFVNCGAEYQRRNQFNRFDHDDHRKRIEAPSKHETKDVDLAKSSDINAFTGKPRTSSCSSAVIQKEASTDVVNSTREERSEKESGNTLPENPFLQSICSPQRFEIESKPEPPPQEIVDFFFTPKADAVHPKPPPSLLVTQPAQILQSAQILESAQTVKSARTSQSAETAQAPQTVAAMTEPTIQAVQVSRVLPVLAAYPVTPSAPTQTSNQLPGSLAPASSLSCMQQQICSRPVTRIERSDRGYSLEFLHKLGVTLASERGLVRPFPFQDSEIILSTPVRNIYHSDFVLPYYPCYAQEQQQAGISYNDTMNGNGSGNGGRHYPNHHQYQGNSRVHNYYPQHSYPMQNHGNYNGATYTPGFNENLRVLSNGVPNQIINVGGPRSPSYAYYSAASGGAGNKYHGNIGGYGNQKYASANNQHSNYGNGKKQQHNPISSSASECSSSPRPSISPGSYRQSISKSRSNQSLAMDSAPKYSHRSAHRMNYNHQNQTHYNGGHSGQYQTNMNYQTYQARPTQPTPANNQNYAHMSYANAIIAESMSHSRSPATLSRTQSITSTASSAPHTYMQNQHQVNQWNRPDNYGINRKRYQKAAHGTRASQVSPFSIGNQSGTSFRVDKSTTATVADFVDSGSFKSAAYIAGNDMDSDSSSTRSLNRRSDPTQAQSPGSRLSTASSSSSTSLQSNQQTEANSDVVAKPLPKLSDVVDFKSYSMFILCHSQELSKHLVISTRQQQSMQQQAAQQYVSFEQSNGHSPPPEKNPDRLLELWGAARGCNYYSEIFPLTADATPSAERSPSLSPRNNNQQGDSAEVCHLRVSQASNIPLHMTTIIGTTADQQLMQMGHLPESLVPGRYWLYLPYNQDKPKVHPITPQGDSVTCHKSASVPLISSSSTPHQLETLTMPRKIENNSKWDHLSQAIWSKFVESQQTEKTFMQKLHLWRFLNATVKNIYPLYGLYIVGSTITGFGADSSDADMCLISRMNVNSDPRLEAISNLVHLRECLRKTKQFEEFNLIEARVPILRFRDRVHGQEVDLNYNNAVGIRNTHLLYLYSQLDWRLRPLVLITKQWAQFHDINNAKNMTISSYSLVLMMIHFLQCGAKPQVLPCLHAMYPDKFPLLRSNNDFGFVDMTEAAGVFTSSNRQSLGELFIGFLEYYSLFRYHEMAISVRTGGVIPISTCRQVKAQRNDIHQWKELCIEEPFDLTNTARSVYDYETFERVKWVFVSSWRMLSETLTLDALFTPVAVIPMLTAHFRPNYQAEMMAGDDETLTDTNSLPSAYSSVTNEAKCSKHNADDGGEDEDEAQAMETPANGVGTKINNPADTTPNRSTASVASVATIGAIASDTTAMLLATPAHLPKSTLVATKDAAVEVTVKTSPQSDYHKSQNNGKAANPAVAAL